MYNFSIGLGLLVILKSACRNFYSMCVFPILLLVVVNDAIAQNRLIQNQFTADPTTRVFGNRVYEYPSHDIPPVPGKLRPDWFCMEDYHVFSLANLINWSDHGVVITQNNVPWLKPDSYNMWAPDCMERNGKYYFYAKGEHAGTDLRTGNAERFAHQGPEGRAVYV